jgi:phenol 2-monooxygenase
MQFHQHGYVSHDPMIHAPAGYGIDRPSDLPDELDVLIVGTGPAGMIAAAQLSMFPDVNTRIIERRPGRLEVGQADGIQARSVETFQAFGFATRLIDEAYWIREMAFWKPDPENPDNIVPGARPKDDPHGISEFPHLIVNQARILDHFAEYMANSPSRLTPDYGIEFLGLTVEGDGDYPVVVTLRYTAGPREGEERTVRAKYVVGCDGARSGVRASMGRTLEGLSANHAWGVMDVLADTDFPDIRLKCAIQSTKGSILLIPREGGHLFRMYVDLGEVTPERKGRIRETTLEQITAKANAIIHPYSVTVKQVAWHSVYEVGHRLTDKFDDVPAEKEGEQMPRVFITGDACHTHSAKAGQGMNVSMQDGWNISWKLGQVLTGVAPESLLCTYSAERQVIAKNLIDFDKEWSTLMATPADQLPDPAYLEDFYVKTAEFPAGFMTEYRPSMITGTAEHQDLATGCPMGKRFKSARALRVCDATPRHIGHEATADGRYRVYVFAPEGAALEGASGAAALDEWAHWMKTAADSPVRAHTPASADIDSVFDVRVIFQEDYMQVRLMETPSLFRPEVGQFKLRYLEKVYAALPDEDIFEERGIARSGVVVVVRPDQYVSGIFPLEDREGLAAYFAGALARA